MRSRRNRIRLEGNPTNHAGAKMGLGPFAETKGPRPPGRNPAHPQKQKDWIPTFVRGTEGTDWFPVFTGWTEGKVLFPAWQDGSRGGWGKEGSKVYAITKDRDTASPSLMPLQCEAFFVAFRTSVAQRDFKTTPTRPTLFNPRSPVYGVAA